MLAWHKDHAHPGYQANGTAQDLFELFCFAIGFRKLLLQRNIFFVHFSMFIQSRVDQVLGFCAFFLSLLRSITFTVFFVASTGLKSVRAFSTESALALKNGSAPSDSK
jgi:hypothetical protein